MKNIYLFSTLLLSSTIVFNVNGMDQSSPPNSLVVAESGSVGVGTDDPNKPFHVLRTDGNSSILVEETGTEAATPRRNRTMLRMINNGGPNMSFQDTSNNIGWQFAQTTAGDFAVSKEFSGGSEFILQGSGRVRMGPGSITNFDLRADGNLLIPNGSVTANGILLTSSKTSKTDIEPINASTIIKNLQKMEISEWRYKEASKNDRHMSPMAEDFYSLFNFGVNGKHINPNDLASVALVAAQELKKEVDSLKKDNAALRSSLLEKESMFTQRLSSLEKLITNIANSNSDIPTTGDSVTMNLF